MLAINIVLVINPSEKKANVNCLEISILFNITTINLLYFVKTYRKNIFFQFFKNFVGFFQVLHWNFHSFGKQN